MKSCLLIPILLTPLGAAELTVEARPFRVERQFPATVVPTEVKPIRLEPDSWGDFVIETVAGQGAAVKAGEVVIGFEREAYERALEDLKRGVAKAGLELASQELAFAKSKEETEITLAALRDAKKAADEDLDYFNKTGRPAQEANIAQRLKQYRFQLEAQEEELKQLQMMYDADDLTEETEEIILKRQKDSVEDAKFNLKEVGRTATLSLETSIPRQAAELARAAESATLELEKAEKNLLRSLESSAIDLEQARVAAERQQVELKRLTDDGALLEIKAAVDGVVYHGSFDDGVWSVGEAAKFLLEGGKVPVRKDLLSVVPADSAMKLKARVEAAVARSLAEEAKVAVLLAGREDLAITGEVAAVGRVPEADGKHLIEMTVAWPEDTAISAATTADCRVTTYDNEAAFTVPVKALHTGDEGQWLLDVKLADGKTESRTVQPGRLAGDKIEIVSGLETGQVVIIPE